MTDSLTTQQQQFAIDVAEGNTLSDAYRRSYGAGMRAKAKTIHEEASRLASHPKVSARIAELRAHTAARALKQHAVTTDSLLAECDEALAFARSKEDAHAVIAATKLKAMLTGNVVKERDNARSPLADVPDDQIALELQRLRQEREAASALH